MIRNKRGSSYVEAAVAMPAACLITVGLIGLTMRFYGRLVTQTDGHLEEWSRYRDGYEAEYLRDRDGFERIFKE